MAWGCPVHRRPALRLLAAQGGEVTKPRCEQERGSGLTGFLSQGPGRRLPAANEPSESPAPLTAEQRIGQALNGLKS